MDVATEVPLPTNRDRSRPVKRQWSLCPTNRDLATFLSRQLQVDFVVGTLLVNRGVQTVEEGERFLDRRLKSLEDPRRLPGVEEAADRIFHAARAGRVVCVYGDYDVDGMCATAVLLECLRLAGCQARSHIPDRMEEGYGVNTQALERLRGEGVDLVVTVDCGVTSIEEAVRARAIGLEYIVTDHHELAGGVPPADAVVHPRLPGSDYPFGHLCGTGVAFKLAWEIARRFSGGNQTTDAYRRFLLDATSLAAIGTICDVVPMEGENRVFVHHGLQSLKQSPPLGLAHLLREAGLDARPQFTSEDIAFQLGPRLNACGRLGQARLGVELLTTRDPARASELARFLDNANKERQTIERRIFQEARELASELYSLDRGDLPAAFVLASDNWHPGVIGIVASRMVDRFHRPCIMISSGESAIATGSGRSIDGLHLQETLLACSEYLVTSGGHEMAAGLRIERDRIDDFRVAFQEEARRRLTQEHLLAEICVDLEVPLHVLTPKLIRSLERLEPFGAGNRKPMFLATDLVLAGEPKTMGAGQRHLSFRVQQGNSTLRAVAFGQAERLGDVADDQGRCCVLFEPMINTYRGYPEVELKVRDFQPGPSVR